MTPPETVVIVGESIAGITAARELRRRGHVGRIHLIGDDPHGGYARPPLSKVALTTAHDEADLSYSYDDLDLEITRSAAVDLDPVRRQVVLANGDAPSYDALIIATGAAPRRLASPGQKGELVLRTLNDARTLRDRLGTAQTAIVVGAGFLGMEFASACVQRGVTVTLIDVDLPLQRILGDFLSSQVSARAADQGVRFVRATGPVTLLGNPVRGVRTANGSALTADLVVTCAGDVPAVDWLDRSGLATPRGIGVDTRCATTDPHIYAIGDVCYVRSATAGQPVRAPFWSNAVAQAKVAAASVLGLEPDCAPRDDYFWTEVLGVSIKVVGPLPLPGEPREVEGSVEHADAVLRWHHADGSTTAVAYGRRIPVPRLRAMTQRTA